MKPSSGLSSRRCIPWQGLLLTASLLTFWSPPTAAHLTVETVPFVTAEGGNVLLLVYNLPENLRLYRWYKGASVANSHRIAAYVISTQALKPGSAYSGRETIYPNGSLLFQNVTQEDTGFYTLLTVNTFRQVQQASGQVQVYRMLPKPFITSNNSKPVEGKDAVSLTCKPDTQNTTYLWWRNGQSLPDSDRLKLSKNNKTLTLSRVRRNDTGLYECETRNPLSANRSDPVTLNVLYGPDAPVIWPMDSHFRSGISLRLSCHTASKPPAKFTWLFNGRILKSTQEFVIPQITKSNSGYYTCLVHNSATHLSRTTLKNIIVFDVVTKPSISTNSTTVKEEDSVVLTCLSGDTGISIQWIFNDQILQLTERMTLSQKNSILTVGPVRREDAGEYQCEVSNPVSSSRSDPLRLAVKYDALMGSPVN
ncbi:PREDICTED: carcinoembryonic antigen-related cell adhesion molecule 1-like [Chinchilla lanigera]|uniref:carcinoembryonic antigen-related cell adhesion molecule 1-like n=1 Tax=Chinchilla lanigera TaxID=34839 RepID=UPI00038EFF22|nr:PREDICTED: carcinoembryonic antigen-related cell adhesion molecule 1-like [Chinchilla lanigera]